ncbi:ChbG/HpnK family deacetylase [Oceanispirochaeta crateris]|uniref:ChbG/HpnK family deacetylase n=1 Tax=Oceanispirochaeta crateris TaxID=2518645 RepID=A0A5C1QLG1_9SPIO|nr:ChbG/HpnK family deacetylase [Oceanispirochaeta crateris]QEN06992.1 ChbG/HpnK family deacetylase [Oceanispirochaeta crateris]
MKLHINADDMGASSSVNDSIAQGFKKGALTKLSLMVTTPGFEEACEMIRIEGWSHSLHLNFCEGRPITSPLDIPLLVDKNGCFDKGFIQFWLNCIFSKRFLEQVAVELEAQMKKYSQAFPDQNNLSLDSHQYYHLIPPVLNKILYIIRENPRFTSIRTVREPFLILRSNIHFSIQNICSSNLIKWILLRYLTFHSNKPLRLSGVQSNRYFCGVLYSGNMSYDVYTAFKRFIEKRKFDADSAEILFHPGGASHEDEKLWDNQKDLLRFYRSSNRDNELDELIKIARETPVNEGKR